MRLPKATLRDDARRDGRFADRAALAFLCPTRFNRAACLLVSYAASRAWLGRKRSAAGLGGSGCRVRYLSTQNHLPPLLAAETAARHGARLQQIRQPRRVRRRRADTGGALPGPSLAASAYARKVVERQRKARQKGTAKACVGDDWKDVDDVFKGDASLFKPQQRHGRCIRWGLPVVDPVKALRRRGVVRELYADKPKDGRPAPERQFVNALMRRRKKLRRPAE